MGHWDAHPHVRTGTQLRFRERAADRLKMAFGTWTLLGAIIAGIAFWMLRIHDPGELHLNLGLSFLASVQGVILQIAANRGDRIASEVAAGTHQMARQLLAINNQQLEILAELRQIRDGTGRTVQLEFTGDQQVVTALRKAIRVQGTGGRAGG